MKLTIEEHWFLNDWIEEWEKRFQTPSFGRWNIDDYWNKKFSYDYKEIGDIISQVRNAKGYIHSTSTEQKQKLNREKLIALTFIAEMEIEEFVKTGRVNKSINNEIWDKWIRQSEEPTEQKPKLQKTQPVKYSLGEPPISYDESFEIPVQSEESLFCDTEFLERFFKKPVRKSKECK